MRGSAPWWHAVPWRPSRRPPFFPLVRVIPSRDHLPAVTRLGSAKATVEQGRRADEVEVLAVLPEPAAGPVLLVIGQELTLCLLFALPRAETNQGHGLVEADVTESVLFRADWLAAPWFAGLVRTGPRAAASEVGGGAVGEVLLTHSTPTRRSKAPEMTWPWYSHSSRASETRSPPGARAYPNVA